MGWVNYVIVPKWKIAFIVSRYIDYLDDFQGEALNKIIEINQRDEDRYVEDTKLSEMTLGDLKILLEDHNIIKNLIGIDDPVYFLLYFLQKEGFEFEILSEFNVNEEELKKEGYKIIDLLG